MPITLQTNDVIEVRLEFQINGNNDKAYNVLHYRAGSITELVSGLPVAIAMNADPLLATAAGGLYLTLASGWKQCGSANVLVSSCSVQKVHSGTRSEEYTHIPAAPVLGEIPGDALPMQDCVTLLKRTGIGERWGMGRVFVAGVPEDAQSNGRVLDLAIGNYQAFGTVLASQTSTDDGTYQVTWIPVLYFKDEGTVRVNPITRVTLSNNIIKSQKRRRPGKGI